MKLLTQYNRINITLMAGIFLLASIAFYMALTTILIHEVDESLDVTIAKIKEYVKLHQTMPENIADRSDDVIISYKPADQKKSFGKKEQTIKHFNPYENKYEKYRQISFGLKVNTAYYEVSIARPLEGTSHLLRNIAVITLITLFCIVVTITVANRIVFRKLWRPFYQSLEYLKSYKVGSAVPFALPVTRTDEFNTMNAAMELAMNKAGNDYQSLKEFTENASHEMQTPLAIIRTKLDLLSQESDFSEKQSELLQGAHASINRLSRLNKSLLLLAKIENQQFDQIATIHLKDKLSDKMNLFKEIWENEQIQVTASLSSATLLIDTNLCDILLNNLLSNATNHNYTGGTIAIILKPGFLSVTNTSHSPEANGHHLFKRFYKAQASSTHHGLGLSIVKEICDYNGISIEYRYHRALHTFTLQWMPG